MTNVLSARIIVIPKTVVNYISLYHNQKSTFLKLSYFTTNWTSKVNFLRLWVVMITSYMSGIVIFMVKWYGTRSRSRVCGSILHGDLTENRLKSLSLTLNTLTCSNYVSFKSFITIQACQLSYLIQANDNFHYTTDC